MSSQEELVENGSRILARYQHPDDWEDGWKTGKNELIGKKALKVEMIRVGGLGFVSEPTSEFNARSILAWASSRGIKLYQLSLIRERDKAPYVIVDNSCFTEVVLPHLQTLRESS